MENAVRKTDGAPVVPARSSRLPQSRRDNGKRKFLGDDLHHALERIDIEGSHVLSSASNFETKRRGKILLVADHHVHQRGEAAVYGLRLLLPSDGLPERRPVVQIV